MSESNQALVDALVKFQRWCDAGGPDLTAQLTAATARAEAMEKKLHLLRFGVATLVERFHHWSQTDGDMGWSKGMREAGDELDELLSQPEVSDGK